MNNLISNIFLALILIFGQALFFNNINFLGSINPLIYIYFIAYFPLKNNRTLFIFCAFIYGFIIDIFSDTHAIHAAATLTIASCAKLQPATTLGIALCAKLQATATLGSASCTKPFAATPIRLQCVAGGFE